MKSRVFVVGVGMTKFLKPREDNPDYPELTKQAVTRALLDAGIKYEEVKAAVAGYVYGDSTCGQRALYEVGMTGIPIYNVNNNCSTGSTAIQLGHSMIATNQYDCVLAFGFEKMQRGSLKVGFTDRTNPLDKIVQATIEFSGQYTEGKPFAPQIFGNAGIEHMKLYGTKPEHFAKVAYKNHLHSKNNPYSQFKDVYTLDEILNSQSIHGPLTKLQCCPTSDGAGASILCNEAFVKKHGLEDQAVEILSIAITTDMNNTFDERSCMNVAGYDMSKRAAEQVFKESGVSPKEVGVVELHDCFSANELMTYEAIGLIPVGTAGKHIDEGYFTYGGKVVVNPSGGLISKGHPLGATGLAQCAELNWQLRGMAGARQVPNLKYALQHNIGLGGACVVVLYKKYNNGVGYKRPEQSADPEILEKMTPKL